MKIVILIAFFIMMSLVFLYTFLLCILVTSSTTVVCGNKCLCQKDTKTAVCTDTIPQLGGSLIDKLIKTKVDYSTFPKNILRNIYEVSGFSDLLYISSSNERYLCPLYQNKMLKVKKTITVIIGNKCQWKIHTGESTTTKGISHWGVDDNISW